MSDPDKTLPPVSEGKAERLMRRYAEAESRFDRFLILVGGLKYTLIFFAAWTVFAIWLGAKVFG